MVVPEEASSNDEEQEDTDIKDTEEDGESDDYELFSEMLCEAKKAIVERKKHWEETGDSFILDHFSETMRVNDWVKLNLNDTASSNMDISKMYGDMCKKKKLQSTFLESVQRPIAVAAKSKTTPRKSKSVEPLSPIKMLQSSSSNSQRTPSTHSQPPQPTRSLSESTFNRRKLASAISSKKRNMLNPVRRLSTVPESPSAARQTSPMRRTASIGDIRLPRTRTVIYTPTQRIVHEQFRDVLKRQNFDPNKMLVYEPPSDANSSSESDDDIFLTCKRKFGGKIVEL